MSEITLIPRENHRTGAVETYIHIKDAQLLFRNFAGEAGQYNNAGTRSFSVIIDDPTMVDRLKEEGWNVRQLKQRDEYTEPDYKLDVAVDYRHIRGIKPMEITLLKRTGAINVDEEMAPMLDYATITSAELIIRPREWEPGRIKAYLSEMVVTIEENYLNHESYESY